MDLLTGNFEARLRKIISFAWHVFMEKVGGGLFFTTNKDKEKEMCLKYMEVLEQIVPLTCFKEGEEVKIYLKEKQGLPDKERKIDLVLSSKSSQGQYYKIAIEMRCYRTLAESGKPRNASDIFVKDVYEDMYLLERYCSEAGFDRGCCFGYE